jgi:hypothetical protein
MARPWTVRIIKRDGCIESFNRLKLRRAFGRAIGGDDALFLADLLSSAVAFYLRRRRLRCVTSAALLEMALTSLRAAALRDAAAAMEQRHWQRAELRRHLAVRHEHGAATAWSKQWLVQQARSQWHLSRPLCRILAGQVEESLLGRWRHRLSTSDRSRRRIDRSGVLAMLEQAAAEYGLADAMPALT